MNYIRSTKGSVEWLISRMVSREMKRSSKSGGPPTDRYLSPIDSNGACTEILRRRLRMTCGAGNPVTLSLYSSPIRAIPQPSAPEGLSNFRTLRTFGAKGSVNPHAKGVSKDDTTTLSRKAAVKPQNPPAHRTGQSLEPFYHDPSRRPVFITDCLKCGMYRDSSPEAQNDRVRREIS